MKKASRFLAMLMVTVTILHGIFYSYSITVNATSFLGSSFLNSLLSLFGVEIGLGGSSSSVGTIREELEELLEGTLVGEALTIAGYGDVDLSDSVSIQAWLKTCQSAINFKSSTLLTATTTTLLRNLDKLSYLNTGTSATKSMSEMIDDVASNVTAAEIQDVASILKEGNGDSVLTWRQQQILSAMAAASIVSEPDTYADWVVNLTYPESSQFQVYDFEFKYSSAYPYPYYSNVNDPYMSSYSDNLVWAVYDRVCINCDSGPYEYIMTVNPSDCEVASSDYKPFFFATLINSVYNFYYLDPFGADVYTFSPKFAYYCPECDEYVHNAFTPGGSFAFDKIESIALPIFESKTAAQAFYNNGSVAGLIDGGAYGDYSEFKENALSAYMSYADVLAELFAQRPTISGVTSSIPSIVDKAGTVAGTTTAVTDISAVISSLAGLEDSMEGTEENTSGILSVISTFPAILNSIKDSVSVVPSLLQSLWGTVSGFPTVLQGILDGIIDIPAKVGEFVDNILLRIDTQTEEITAVKEAVQQPPEDEDDNEYDSSSIPIFNGLLLLIYILFKLLMIFLHFLEFIVNVFKIPAAPGFLNDDMLVGLNFIKSFQIGDWGISVYDFLMTLVHMLIFFAVVKMFKQHIDRLHLK